MRAWSFKMNAGWRDQEPIYRLFHNVMNITTDTYTHTNTHSPIVQVRNKNKCKEELKELHFKIINSSSAFFFLAAPHQQTCFLQQDQGVPFKRVPTTLHESQAPFPFEFLFDQFVFHLYHLFFLLSTVDFCHCCIH